MDSFKRATKQISDEACAAKKARGEEVGFVDKYIGINANKYLGKDRVREVWESHGL